MAPIHFHIYCSLSNKNAEKSLIRLFLCWNNLIFISGMPWDQLLIWNTVRFRNESCVYLNVWVPAWSFGTISSTRCSWWTSWRAVSLLSLSLARSPSLIAFVRVWKLEISVYEVKMKGASKWRQLHTHTAPSSYKQYVAVYVAMRAAGLEDLIKASQQHTVWRLHAAHGAELLF